MTNKTSFTSSLFLAFISVLALIGPAAAQAPSPAEAASAYTSATTSSEQNDFDLERSETRRTRARRMRITGLSLIGASVALAGTMALVGLADDSCDHATDTFTCIDGPKLWGITGAYLAAPVLASGIALTTSGYVIERRERRRISVNASATGLRLSF